MAICKAVMIGIAPDARIMDITHQVTPYAIEEIARFLSSVTPYYPAGTVFVAVIDPGVGTSRRAVIAKTKKSDISLLLITGLISPVLDRDGLDSAREITNPARMIGDNVSSTTAAISSLPPLRISSPAGTTRSPAPQSHSWCA